ncbi:DNA gyrase subunit A [Fibrobacter sp.]|uniref:DNA gyrase subunit A n=1 Tax=Fibrobacter sp. TaxID=35828 RepID=UPI003868AD98
MNTINNNDTKQMELYPDVRDGLTSVQRKIFWALSDASKPTWNRFVRSTTVAFFALIRYIPCEDDDVNKALADMALFAKFDAEWPLIREREDYEPLRNSAARYTEVKISRIGKAMLDGVEKNAVPLYDNYNGMFKEPLYLPSMFPNLLVNGFEGACASVPPHDFLDVITCVRDCCNGASQSHHPLLDDSRTFSIWTGEKVEKLSFAQMLKLWIDHRIECLQRTLSWDVKNAKKRLHCLEGQKVLLQDFSGNFDRLRKYKDFLKFCTSMGFDEEQNKYLEKLSFVDIATSDVESEISLVKSELAGLRKTLNSKEALLRIILEQLETLANSSRTKRKKA